MANANLRTVEKVSRSRKQKEQDILKSASKIFVRDGFEKAHMDEIAQAANVSKQTIYSNFGSKENLFNEIVSDIFKELQKETLQEPQLNCPQKALSSFLERTMTPLYSPKGVALYRLSIAEGQRNAKLGQIFVSRIERGITRLATVLEKLHDKGLIEIDDSHESAHNLIYACKGLTYSKLLCGYDKSISKEEIAFLAQKQAEMFLQEHGCSTKCS